MATEVERLITLLEARISGYERELKKASQLADRHARTIETRFGAMNANVTRSFRQLAAAVAVGAFAEFARRSIAAAATIGETAKAVDLSAESYQGYRFAAAEAGVETTAFDGALKKFVQTLGEAQRGGEQARLFTALGVSIKDSAGNFRDTESVFRDTVDAISRVRDPATANALALDLMGRSASGMARFLRAGTAAMDDGAKKARDLGIVISDAMIERAGQANRELKTMGEVLRTAGANIAFEFIPAIHDVADILTDPAFLAGSKTLANNVRELVHWLVDNKEAVIAVAGALAGLKLAGPVGAVAGAAGATALTGTLDEVNVLDKRLKALKAERDRLTGSLAGKTPILGDLLIGDTDRQIAEIEQRLKSLRGEIAKTRAAEAAPTEEAAAGLPADLQPPGRKPPQQDLVIDPAFAKLPQLENFITGLQRAAEAEGDITSAQREEQALRAAQAILVDAEGHKIRDLSQAEEGRVRAALRLRDANKAAADLDQLDVRIDGLKRLADAYAVGEEAGARMAAQLAAEDAARRNAAVDVDEYARKLDHERQARERIEAVRTLAAMDRDTAALLAQADALSEATIRWNEYTGAFEVNDREARILAETHRLLAGNTQLSAEEARKAAEAHVDAAERLEKADQKAGAASQRLNEQQAALKGAISGFVSDLRRGEDAVTALGTALGNLGERLFELALDDLFKQLFAGSTASQNASAATPAASGGGAGLFASILGAVAGALLHGGGVVGEDGRQALRARRGTRLRPNEVITVLETGEEVVTQEDPRHRKNLPRYHTGGLAGALPDIRANLPAIAVPRAVAPARPQPVMSPPPAVDVPVKIVNAFDSATVMSEALGTPIGSRAIVNFVRDNARTVRGALGIR